MAPQLHPFPNRSPSRQRENPLYLRKLWNRDACGNQQDGFLSLASGRRDGEVGAISGVFGDPEKAGAELDVSNLAVIQRAATVSDRSDMVSPWLTASGQTTILLHSGGEGGIQSKLEEQPRAK